MNSKHAYKLHKLTLPQREEQASKQTNRNQMRRKEKKLGASIQASKKGSIKNLHKVVTDSNEKYKHSRNTEMARKENEIKLN